MIAHTIPQAAARVGRSIDTIRQWIREGHLTAVRHPVDGQRYVSEDQLVDVERSMRLAQRATRAVQPANQESPVTVTTAQHLNGTHIDQADTRDA